MISYYDTTSTTPGRKDLEWATYSTAQYDTPDCQQKNHQTHTHTEQPKPQDTNLPITTTPASREPVRLPSPQPVKSVSQSTTGKTPSQPPGVTRGWPITKSDSP